MTIDYFICSTPIHDPHLLYVITDGINTLNIYLTNCYLL